MAMDHFIVALKNGHWTTSHHGTDEGPFTTKQGAIDSAIEAAKAANTGGKRSEVIVENEDRKFETAWRPDQNI